MSERSASSFFKAVASAAAFFFGYDNALRNELFQLCISFIGGHSGKYGNVILCTPNMVCEEFYDGIGAVAGRQFFRSALCFTDHSPDFFGSAVVIAVTVSAVCPRYRVAADVNGLVFCFCTGHTDDHDRFAVGTVGLNIVFSENINAYLFRIVYYAPEFLYKIDRVGKVYRMK